MKERPVPSSALLSIFPSGEYRMHFDLVVGDNFLFNITSDTVLTTPDKNTYG